MSFRTVSAALAAGMFACAGSALAGTLFSSIPSQNIFGQTYGVNIYRVAGDLLPNGPRLEPEGMTFYNGVLYVSGDGGATSTPNETNGFIAAYAGGALGSNPTAIGQFALSGRAIGPEGITVNTRGSGYGSFSGSTPRLVAVDSAGGSVGRILTALNPAGPAAEDVQSNFINTDDIAYLPGATAAEDRFAIIDGGTTPPSLKYYSTDNVPAPVAGGWNLVNQAKGLAFLSAADAALFSPAATSDCLLVAVGPDFAGDTNKLLLYTLGGTLLETANFASGTGAGLFGGIEDLAWDPVNRLLYIGDENGANSQIAVVSIPAPASGLLLGLACVTRSRRRR